MVNSKKRDILERYCHLLESNMILTDSFLQWFQDKRILPDFIFDDVKLAKTPLEKNKKFLASVMDNGDVAFTKLVEGFIANGQPFLGDLLDGEDKRSSESTANASDRVIIDDEMLKRCPGVDRLRADVREKLKMYLQSQLLRAHLNDSWKSQNQSSTVEMINLKRQHYETQQKLSEAIEEEKRTITNLSESLRSEQTLRQQKDREINELRNELSRLQSDFEMKWSSQMKMVDASNRSLFKMNDKISILADWFTALDNILKISVFQVGTQFDSAEQLQVKLRRYTSEIESLRMKGIGTEKLKEELYEAFYTSRFLPISDRKNKPLHDLLVHLFGADQVTELSKICTKDVLQSKLEMDQSHEIRLRDIKIDELQRINHELQAELDRLKSKSTASVDQTKTNKPQWRPAASPVVVAARDKNKSNRQTLKPMSVQFGTKPAAN